MALPRDDERVEMLLAAQPDKFTREQAEVFVANTPHHEPVNTTGYPPLDS